MHRKKRKRKSVPRIKKRQNTQPKKKKICIGRIEGLSRCKEHVSNHYFPFCRKHRWQPLLFLIMTLPGIFADWGSLLPTDDELDKEIVELKEESIKHNQELKKIIENQSERIKNIEILLNNEILKSAKSRDFQVIREALGKTEESAQIIAAIDEDNAVSIVKEALNVLEKRNGIERALLILDKEHIDNLKKSAFTNKDIEQVIEAYKLRIELLTSRFEYEQIDDCLKEIIELNAKTNPKSNIQAKTYKRAGDNSRLSGKFNESLEYQKKSIGIFEINLTPDHPDLAATYNSIALTYRALGEYQNALQYHQKSITIFEKKLDLKDPILAVSYGNIGLTYRALGKYNKALETQQKCVNLLEEILDSRHLDLATAYNNLAATYQDLGKYEKALEFQMKSISILEESLESNHPFLASSYGNIAIMFSSLKQYEKALQFEKKEISIQEEIFGSKHPSLATSYSNIALTYQDLGQFKKAIEFQERSIDIFKEILNPNHPSLATAYHNFGGIYQALKQYEKALEYQLKSIKIRQKILNEKHPFLGVSYTRLALTYYHLNELDKAVKFIKKGKEIINEAYPPTHPYQDGAKLLYDKIIKKI